MQWIQEHSIANMHGPHFLVVYGLVIIVTLGACWWMIQRTVKPRYSGKNDSVTNASQEILSSVVRIKFAGACVIVGLGGYKLLVALAKGKHNVGFLILMCVVALCILFAMQISPSRNGRD